MFFETGYSYVVQAAFELIGHTDWSGIHNNPTSASQVLGVQVCATMPRKTSLNHGFPHNGANGG